MKSNYTYYKVRDILLIAFISISIIVLSFIFFNDRFKEDTPTYKPTSFSIKEESMEYKYNEELDLAIEPKIKIYLTKENRIEEFDLEEYIIGVVGAEMPAEFELEALKAQAVAARTYALAHMESAGGQKYFNAKGADLDDTINCQVYIGKDARLRSWPEGKRDEYWNKLSQAVKETYGVVITYDNEIIKNPFYFSTSSGKTENVNEVFSGNIPYLKSVESPGEEVAPRYTSDYKMSYSEAISVINNYFSNSNISKGNIYNQIQILKRTEGGSVKEISIGDNIISGSKFRTMFRLSSANFDIEFDDGFMKIACKGYGHGVGMSQWGANVMAKEGSGYNEILKHYYQGIELKRLEYIDK